MSFHLIFLRKVDGCWSLVSMRHIIHKFVNVNLYIAYSCEVAIHNYKLNIGKWSEMIWKVA